MFTCQKRNNTQVLFSSGSGNTEGFLPKPGHTSAGHHPSCPLVSHLPQLCELRTAECSWQQIKEVRESVKLEKTIKSNPQPGLHEAEETGNFSDCCRAV